MPLRSKLALLLCLSAAPLAAQTTIHVPADQPTIQAGINAAKNGDTVLVSPGTYFENIDFKGKAITLTSSDGAASTIIDGSHGAGPVVSIKSGEPRTAVLSNLTVRNGNGVAYAYDPFAGVYLLNSAPTLLNNTITNNACWDIASYSSAPVIQGNEISATQSPNGGCGFGSGAGILIWGNLASSYPAASNGTAPLIVGNTIENNVRSGLADAGGNGGAAVAVWGGSPLIKNNIMRNNASPGGSGGAVNVVGGTATIVQNLIYGNSAGCGGGALAWEAGGNGNGYNLLIANNTMVDNTTSTDGGGFSECTNISQIYAGTGTYGSDQPFSIIVNNIISGDANMPAINCSWFDSPSEAIQPMFDHNILFNSGNAFFGKYCVDTSTKYGNIVADPQFVNAAAHDYHLQATSPAVDHGNNSVIQALLNFSKTTLPTDFDGKTRQTDATGQGYPIIDMGAYELAGVTSGSPPTTLLVSSNSYYGAAGNGYVLTASLASSLGVPTGSVTFFLDGKQLGASLISSAGIATFSNFLVRPGVHNIVATYPGQGSFAPAVSIAIILNISLYTDTVTLTSSPNPSLLNQAVTFTVHTASADTGFIPGPVKLVDGSNTLATLTPDASGNATYTTSTLAVGGHSIYAYYAGDSQHAAAQGYVYQHVIDPNDTTTTLSAAPNLSVFGTTVQFTATVVSAGNTVPTGSVNFTYNGNSIGTAPLNASGTATLSYSGLPVGWDIVTATYVPTGTFHASNGSVSEQVVTAIPTTTTVTCSPSTINIGGTSTFTAFASANGTIIPGTFTFTGLPTAANVDSTTGTASTAYTFQTPGLYIIRATFTTASTTYASSSATCDVTVNSYPLTITLSAAPNPATVGQTVTLSTAFAATYPPGSGGHQFTGQLAFYDGTTFLGLITPSSDGFTFSTASLAAGTHTLRASYVDPNYGTGTTSSNGVTLTVTALPSIATLTASPTNGLYGTPLQISAGIAPATPPGSGVPTGTVAFTIDGTPLPPAPPLANGATTLTLNNYRSGIHQLSCTYSGDATYAPSTCPPVSVDINPLPSAITITSSQNPSLAYAPVTFTIHLTINGQPAPAGLPFTFSLMANSGNFLLTTDANGNATYTTSQLFARTWDTVADFSAGNYIGSTTHYEQIVTAAPTTLTLTASPNPAYVGQAVTFTAAASPEGAAFPTGVVTFLEGATALGTGTLDATGHATFSTSTLSVGTHNVTAAFPGDPGFAPATSPAVAEVIQPSGFTIALSPATLSLKSGTSGTSVVQLGTIGSFSGPLQLTLGPPPAYATATLSASSVTLTTGATGTSTLSINTMAIAALHPHDHPGAPHRSAEVLAASLTGLLSLLLLPSASSDRRRRLTRALMLVLAAVALTSTTGCLNEWYTRHTVGAGTYDLPVTATDQNGTAHTANLTLTVTP